MNSKIIYTIGHGNSELKPIVELLRKHGIKILVDVRSTPYSRFAPEFNNRSLRRSAKTLGIEYKFAGDSLGGRPEDLDCYDGDQVNYDKLADKDFYKKGIRRLIEISQEESTAILCSEENPHHCHRHKLIAQTLLQKGFDVLHIRHNGKFEKAEIELKQQSLF